MKFKAVLTDQLCMKDFFNIVSTMAKLSKRAIFNITTDGIILSNIGATINNANPLLWAVIDKTDFFSIFCMEGVDKRNNEIWLNFYPEQIATALNTFKNFVKVIKIKLTKKQFPCLSIDIEMAPQNSNNFRRLVHDVPVTVISTREWNEYKVPDLQSFEISIQMPSLKSLRTLCDKMKNLSPTLTVVCGTNGDMSFIVETDSSMVVSRYFNLVLEEKLNHNHQTKPSEPIEFSCQIDTKQLAHVFTSMQMLSPKMVGNMVQDQILNIKINIRENVVIFCNIYTVDTT